MRRLLRDECRIVAKCIWNNTKFNPAEAETQREVVLTKRLDTRLELPLCGNENMFLKLFSNSRELEQRLNPVPLQYRRVSDAYR